MKHMIFTLLVCTLVSATVNADTLRIAGNELEYEQAGSGQLVVLFDAGALTGMAGWDAIWDDLPASVTAIRFSRLGEGNSDPCDGQRTAADHVEEVRQVLDTLGIEKPVVYVGHSLGGNTARHYASTYPGDVLGMLLVDPENPRDVELITEIDPQNGPEQIAEVKEKDYALSRGRWCFLDLIWEKAPLKDYADIGDIPVTLIASVKQSPNPKTAFRSDLGRKRWGEIQREWVTAFPRGKYVATTNSGHYIQKEEPALVSAELRLLLQRLGRAQQASR